ncbi:MAG: hypothetical protein ACLFQU_07730 [Candidatus Kapaibacterium sp.]
MAGGGVRTEINDSVARVIYFTRKAISSPERYWRSLPANSQS